MPDYIYLLENRLSADQRNALLQLREAARNAGMLLFLTGDAVRDLTSGHAVRDLEIAVHGNALKLKKPIEELGGKVWGEDEASRSLYLCFPGTVRVDVVSTHRVEYPKPGKPVFHPASIQEDLRRRDFTVNAMAISLNEGSFGLLMDPLNGAADIEFRTLRLVSNYGFLEDPSLLIRATRYRARLGWDLDPKSMTRYENAQSEGVIESISSHARSRELEQIGHEEDGLKVLRALEAEGWMKVLFPAWTSAKADEEKLRALHELGYELLMQGVHADMSAAQMQLLTATLAPKELKALKKLMLRPGFVAEWDSLDALAAGFQKVLLAKQNAAPSASYKLFTTYDPEAVLWLGFTSKAQTVLERFNLFLKVWPDARQRIPYGLMQEMRITPELPAYSEVVHAVFLALIDGRLTTPEEMRAFLEPYSPPAPPPQATIRRTRAKRSAGAKLKEESFDEEEEPEEGLVAEDDLEAMGGDEEVALGLSVPTAALDGEIGEETESAEDELEVVEAEPAPAPVPAVENPPARKVRIPAPDKAGTPAALPSAEKPAEATKAPPASLPKSAPARAPMEEAAAEPGATAAKAPTEEAAAKPGATAAKAPAATKKKAVPLPSTKAAPLPSPAQGKKAGASAVKRPAAAKAAQAKHPPEAPAKVAVKAASRKTAKAAPVKSADAKRKPAPAARAKPGKAPARSKPSSPSAKAAQKPAHKPAKKR